MCLDKCRMSEYIGHYFNTKYYIQKIDVVTVLIISTHVWKTHPYGTDY